MNPHRITNHPHPALSNIVRYVEYISHLHNSVDQKIEIAVKITHYYIDETQGTSGTSGGVEVYIPQIVPDKIDVLRANNTNRVDIEGTIVLPNENGEYPEGTFIEYYYWLQLFMSPQVVLNIIDYEIVKAANKGRFDNYSQF